MHPDAGPTGSAPKPGITRRGGPLHASVTGIAVLVLAAATWYVHQWVTDPVALAYWWAGNGLLLLCAYAFLTGNRDRRRPTPPGRIVAVVPAFEQNSADLHACVRSILDQEGVVVDEVHVVDHGSVHRPVQPFDHPRVRWHRTRNDGRRAAQVYVLDRLEPGDWEFVLTVDSSYVLDELAVQHQLRAFARPRVMATTGLVLVRNAWQSLFTRVADVHVGTSFVRRQATPARPAIAEVHPGAPAVYRAALLFRLKHRYLAAAGHGDDRLLAVYAAFEGDVVGVSESIAWTRTPDDVESVFRQLLVWSRSWWGLIPTAVTGPKRLRGTAFRLFTVGRLVVGPMTIVYAFVAVAVGAGRGTLHWPAVVLFAAWYLLVRYATTGLYLAERPGVTSRQKLWAWLLLTPVATVGNLVCVVPIKYIALLRPRWRGQPTWLDEHRPAPDPGTLYFAGYLPPEPSLTEDAAVLVAAVPGPSDDRGETHE